VGPSVSVGTLLERHGAAGGLALDLLAGAAGLDRRITQPHVQKTGLALAGFEDYVRPGRVLIIGESEVGYLLALEPDRRTDTLRRVLQRDLPCVLVTTGLEPPGELVAEADRVDLPLLGTALPTAVAIARLTLALDDWLAPRETRHGVLLDILGLGVLLTGESGIGKSECALDLIGRGHRLVADDAVDIRCRSESILIGTCPDLTRHHVEIRGLGLLNVTDIFGVSATRGSKRVELVVELVRWDPTRPADRLGLDQQTTQILGQTLPLLTIPVGPGRHVAMLVEVAARNQLLRTRGRHAAGLLADRLERRLERLAEQDSDENEMEAP